MENKTLIHFLILLILLFSCKSINNKLVQNKYTPTSNPLLFNDLKGDLYFGIYFEGYYTKEKRYFFINELGLNDYTISTIDTIIDLKTFSKCEGTDIYFTDKNRVYSFGSKPARWPLLNELELNIEDLKIIDSITIKDNQNRYYRGIKVFK